MALGETRRCPKLKQRSRGHHHHRLQEIPLLIGKRSREIPEKAQQPLPTGNRGSEGLIILTGSGPSSPQKASAEGNTERKELAGALNLFTKQNALERHVLLVVGGVGTR